MNAYQSNPDTHAHSLLVYSYASYVRVPHAH